MPALHSQPNGQLKVTPKPPATPNVRSTHGAERLISLELEDGTVYEGYSFGAEGSVAGEMVFQTGMVGYPESITDPSYRGQILVITFPLVGNYGVPSRVAMDELLNDIPAYFESSEIHIAGLITASYSGEDYSHHLATSSLGTWLQEQGVPAMWGVDTRALTKRIREEGSMLGRMLLQRPDATQQPTNGIGVIKDAGTAREDWRSAFEDLDWSNPNTKNLVADGETLLYGCIPDRHSSNIAPQSRRRFLELTVLRNLLNCVTRQVDLSAFYALMSV